MDRLRRIRASPAMRRLVAETRLSPSMLVQPLFVEEGLASPRAVASLPGVSRLPVKHAVQAALEAADRGVGGVLFFGVPSGKDETGASGRRPDSVVQAALRAVKAEAPDLVVAADTCLCAYTTHGHCGVLRGAAVDNDATLPMLAEMAVAQAEAGADLVAPSAMMDAQVGAIRAALDRAGFPETGILSDSTKFASAFSGPFREAAGSTPATGDRRGYQLPPGNAREAVRESLADETQGADLLMVKPAGPYLDVIRAVRDATRLPLAAYQVSGERAMIEAAAAAGALEREAAVLESLAGIRRAGADVIITYYATEFASRLPA
ncbi:MAG: porphobilinogen synthase [Methanobacteriota archaeon]